MALDAATAVDSLDGIAKMAGMEWISVTERMPEDGRAVLVCWSAGTGMMGVGQMRSGQWLYKYDIDEDEWAAAMQQPTHWMPLPEPPRP